MQVLTEHEMNIINIVVQSLVEPKDWDNVVARIEYVLDKLKADDLIGDLEADVASAKIRAIFFS